MKRLVKLFPLLVLLMGNPVSADESMVSYDRFNAPLFDLSRWRLFEFAGSENSAFVPGPAVLGDHVLAIASGRARMMSRGFGGTSGGDWGTFYRLELNFTNPAAVTAMQATVVPIGIEINGTCFNPAVGHTHVRLQLRGAFFHNGVSPQPGNLTNNVVAFIAVRRIADPPSPPNVVEVIAQVVLFLDNGINFQTLYVESLGHLHIGQPARLSIQWDKANDQFIFRRDKMERIYNYFPLSDATPPTVTRKHIRLANDIPHCTDGTVARSFLDILIDDVAVNPEAAP